MTSLYVYAVLAAPPRVAVGVGVRREAVRVTRCGRLFVAVGAMPAAPPITARAVRVHDAVVRRLAARVDAVLPARFGTVFQDRAALARALAEREGTLREALRLVEGREQMTLRLYGEAAQLESDVRISGSRDDDETTEGGDDGAGGAGTRYLARRLRGRDLPALARLRPFLARVVVAERVERHAAPPLLASAYHLIPRGTSKDYRAEVARAGRALAPLRVRVSGPWPAYAFAPAPTA
jgi:hypothetical protein